MRLFLVVALVMSFSAFAQNSRVRENIKQSSVSSPAKSQKKQVEEKKKPQAQSNAKKQGQ